MNLETIEKKLRDGGNSPHDLADMKAHLSGVYSFYAGRLEEILARKPAIWGEMRKENKSDLSTDRQYQATADGIDEMGLRLRMKRIEKNISAINSLLRVAEGESHNSY